MNTHYISVNEGYNTLYLSHWDGSEPVLSDDAEDSAKMGIREATENYELLSELSFDAEIHACWIPNRSVLGLERNYAQMGEE